jgi:hypothetical protein
MSVLRIRTARAFGRLACVATLLFVVFLPLHFHISLSSQLSSQCTCVQGARAQLVVHNAAPAILPVAQFAILLEAQSDEWNFTAPQRPFVRGPPLSLPV